MLLYNSVGPNPRTVRMFMAERGIELPRKEIDLMGGDNRREPYLNINPFGQLPALELDNKAIIAEITAICEYLDETFPGQRLIGATAEERAEARMWARRIDIQILEPMANGFRYAEGYKLFEHRIHTIPAAANDLKQIAQEWLTRLDKMMAGKQYLCGNRLTLGDIMLFAWLDFFSGYGQPLNPENRNIAGWYDRMKARPSAAA